MTPAQRLAALEDVLTSLQHLLRAVMTTDGDAHVRAAEAQTLAVLTSLRADSDEMLCPKCHGFTMQHTVRLTTERLAEIERLKAELASLRDAPPAPRVSFFARCSSCGQKPCQCEDMPIEAAPPAPPTLTGLPVVPPVPMTATPESTGASRSTWAGLFAAMPLEDRLQTIAEDPSTLDALISEAAPPAPTPPAKDAELLITDILNEYSGERSKEASDACEDCGDLVMCRFHSVISLLSLGTWTTGAIERAAPAPTGAPADLVALLTRVQQLGAQIDDSAIATAEQWAEYYEALNILLAWHPAAPALPPVEADTMPTIKVGDTIVHGRPHEPPQFMYEVTDYECRGWQGDANVVAILRPLWRRPSPQEPTHERHCSVCGWPNGTHAPSSGAPCPGSAPR